MASNGEALPLCGIVDNPWRLMEHQSVPSARSGSEQVNILGEPRLHIEIEWRFADLNADFQEVDSFLLSRQGARFSFVMPRTFRRHPLLHPSGITDTSLAVSGINAANSTVSFGTTGAWDATRGDMLGYYTAAGGYWIGHSEETRSASGGAMSALEVHPAPLAPHATTANPRRSNALGEFRLLGPYDPTEAFKRRGIRLAAIQVIRG